MGRRLIYWSMAVLWLAAFRVSGQGRLAGTNPPSILASGANHRLWGRTGWATNALGRVEWRTNGIYHEIATGLNYRSNQVWLPANEGIQITPTGGHAMRGQHQAAFNTDIAVPLAHTTPEGLVLRSRVYGLSYYDYATGNSVLLAGLTNSSGLVLPTGNQVLYPDAFAGVTAAVRYTYTRAGMEQDIILQEQLPAPESFDPPLNSASTVLQVLTEFFAPPAPRIRRVARPDGRPAHHLEFGSLHLDLGRAFTLGADTNGVVVYPQWKQFEGRNFLVEEVPLPSLLPLLDALPPAPPGHAAAARPAGRGLQALLALPAPNLASAAGVGGPLRLAGSGYHEWGLVLDYAAVVNQANVTFQGDTTYYVSGTVNLSGTTRLEGGAVIKYAANAGININGPLSCLTSPYHPAVLTCATDDTVGSYISGNWALPTAFYAGTALNLNNGLVNTLQCLRICNAQTALGVNQGVGHAFSDLQILRCGAGVAATNADFSVRNALFYNVLINFAGVNAIGRVEQLTSDQANQLCTLPGANLYLTNCLLTAVPVQTGVARQVNTFSLPSGLGVYQTVGTAAHYLATGSPYRGAGTPAINPALALALTRKTTYPPVVMDLVTLSADLALTPVVSRNAGLPDCGYHYDALDFALGFLSLAGHTVTLQTGTAVAGYGSPASSSCAVMFGTGGQFISQGAPTQLNYFVNFNTVQEPANQAWLPVYNGLMRIYGSPANLNCRFTDFSSGFAQDIAHIYEDNPAGIPFCFRDCQFHSGQISAPYDALSLTNCLFERVWAQCGPGLSDNWQAPSVVQNCLFRGGMFDFFNAEFDTVVRNNLFDGTSIPGEGANGVIDHNGYLSGADMLQSGSGDVFLGASPVYQSGPLGNYYLPAGSAVLSAGSATADQLGLYHYTTQISQHPQGTAVVDLGYHYIALNSAGQPLSSDGVGLPDYIADTNGDGVYNAGDFSNWLVGTTGAAGVNDFVAWQLGLNPRVTTAPVKTASNFLGLQIYTPLQ